jgi:hypothetical protein
MSTGDEISTRVTQIDQCEKTLHVPGPAAHIDAATEHDRTVSQLFMANYKPG